MYLSFYKKITTVKSYHYVLLMAFISFILLSFDPVYAYIGPGLGITIFGAIGAVILATFIAIIGIVLWPVRALIRHLKNKTSPETNEQKDIKSDETAENNNPEKLEYDQ